MPLPFTASVPASEQTAERHGPELLTYQQARALLCQLDQQTTSQSGQPGSWLEYCQQQDIFHYVTAEFVTELARVIQQIGPETCVEVAAGAGLLSAALRSKGLAITATDPTGVGKEVIPLSAQQAINELAPDLVVACWPPADANVEMTVLRAPTVISFIYIGQQINGNIGVPQMWSHPEWNYSLLETLLAYSLCRFDYFSPSRQAIVKHSYPFYFSRK